MWHVTYCLSYYIVAELRPVFLLVEMLSAGGSQKPQVRPFMKKSFWRRFAQANNGILAGADPELDTTNTNNHSEMNKQAEERTLLRMAKVHDFLGMRQGSQNLRATQKESCAQKKRMTAVG